MRILEDIREFVVGLDYDGDLVAHGLLSELVNSGPASLTIEAAHNLLVLSGAIVNIESLPAVSTLAEDVLPWLRVLALWTIWLEVGLFLAPLAKLSALHTCAHFLPFGTGLLVHGIANWWLIGRSYN